MLPCKLSPRPATLDRSRDAPAGRVRINVLEDAVELLLKPVMPIFVDCYPEIAIDSSVSNRMSDVAHRWLRALIGEVAASI